jgi:hypothetical protein
VQHPQAPGVARGVARAVLDWLNQPALDSDGRYILGSEGGWALAAPDNIDTSVLQDAQRLVPVGDEELVAVADSPAFPAYVDPTQRWNGWLVPYFRPEVAEVVVAWTVEQHVRDQEACPDVFYWDHGRLVHLDAQYSGYDGHMPDWADPTDSRGGRICIGGYAWTWERAVPPPQTPAPLLPPRGQDQRQKSDPAAPTPSLSSETRTASDSHTGPRHHR